MSFARFAPVTLAVLFAASCSTTTKIVTDQPGATVIRGSDKKELGKTPLTYESKMWIWEKEAVAIRQAGKKTKSVDLKRSEVDVFPMVCGACLTLTGAGCCVGIPVILAGGMKMPETTKVSLEDEVAPPVPTGGAGPAATPSAGEAQAW